MTKSTITRERLEEIRDCCWMDDLGLSMYELSELASMALAAMDSESWCLPLDYLQGHKDGLGWAAQLAEANHPETGDWLYDDPIELAKAIRKGPDMPPVQPVPEYPETLPCPVLLEPGLRFGKGIKTSTMLAALARRAVHESDMAALSTEERAEFQARIENFKALIAQPVPVVPKSISVRDAISALESEDAVTTIGQAYKMGWNACRAAMLQELKKSAGTEAICRSDENVQVLHTKSPAQSDCCPAQNHVSPEQNGDTPAQSQGWIQVSEQMPPSRHEVLVGRWWGEKPRWCCKWATYIPGHPDAQSSGWLIPGASWTPTHWMPLPAAPQEVK
ncbi:TPA: DUF551 domain-containing protein [Klebsiella pneumoniae]|nr:MULTISPECIES: DUF551 domain-containing protein [Klebsiella]AEJ96916.1 hypothetical protein KPN2242_04980 [Klebsiella pneumoniae KCTC 2242]AWG76135.1 DUF551 domain-containing protein [Klebsiella pneumoniae]KPO02596.1 hypothetical protein AO842_03920 [Klebsiella sp. AA405]MBC5137258.1 DUF551 domain-containing protein [Klebsiella pneumoniae]MBW5555178.1 DUF551 domain-containing protein [Klebsiella pneumoniae]